MLNILRKYTDKIANQGLADASSVLYLALDDHLYSYPSETAVAKGKASSLSNVFHFMNINSLLYTVPSDPYSNIISALLKWGQTGSKIVPQDCETRTFFHDIPVIDRPEPDEIARALSERKAAIIAEGPAIVSYGSVSPEQAFVSLSSTCFSTFVKYFYDFLLYADHCNHSTTLPERERMDEFRSIVSCIENMSPPDKVLTPKLLEGPPLNEESGLRMLIEAGRRVVEEGLVDSYFGNISSYYNGKILISETAASLDELEGSVDTVPVDGSSSVGITASSEVSTHRKVFADTGARVILHGHPKFSVIMSMYCTKECGTKGECYKACPEKRSLCNVSIVPGEVGTGPTSIVHTVPNALRENDSVIVYGHGVFCSGDKDFNHPLERMLEIERCCMNAFLNHIRSVL